MKTKYVHCRAFISSLIKGYDKHSISTDGGTWYPQAYRSLRLNHHIHSPYEKCLIERTMQYIKDRIGNFDEYSPCRKENCTLRHVQNWLILLLNMHNKGVKNA
jgi:putative transposase